MRQVAFVMTCALCVFAFSDCAGSGGRGKDVTQVNAGSTNLFDAAKDPLHNETLAMLISSGVDLNAQDEEGMTALHHAAANNNGDAVRKLIRAKADLRIKDAQGRTAEDVAEQGRREKALQVFQRLVR
ncbi:MAG: ankyrin repeat domain-containing protein [Candidatus Hydrogenedentes bacterium]|nr:ankyrin repeat domain-containing protein [Candidatus Hydrogenedentota bacterium]